MPKTKRKRKAKPLRNERYIWCAGDIVLCHDCMEKLPRKYRVAFTDEFHAYEEGSDGWTGQPHCSVCLLHPPVLITEAPKSKLAAAMPRSLSRTKTKFQVGDTVRAMEFAPAYFPQGCEGVVTRIAPDCIYVLKTKRFKNLEVHEEFLEKV